MDRSQQTSVSESGHAARPSIDLNYAAPAPRNQHLRSTISLVCTVGAAATYGLLFGLVWVGVLELAFVALATSLLGLLAFLGLGAALLALAKERPKTRALISLIASGIFFAAVYVLAELFKR